jgi:hypothetical protein
MKLAPIPEKTTAALAEVSTRAAAAFGQANIGELDVTAALAVAESVEQLRALLDTPEVRSRILALQDTSIGFRTDRDPRTKNKKSGEYNQPYDWPVVRDCALEAALRGLQWVGNQFNIITGRCYATKEAFEYLIKRCKAVTAFRPVINVPRVANGGALVECSATWKLNGEPVTYSCVIPVKTDDFSGADQIIGKATRKFLKRCYEQMSGITVPEAEAGEAGFENAVDVTPKAPPAPKPSFAKARPIPVDDDQIPGAEVPPPAPVAAPEPSPQASVPAPPVGPEPDPVQPTLHQADLAAFVASCSATFDHFAAAMKRLNWFPGSDSWGDFLAVPDDFAKRMLKAKHGLRDALRKEVAG